jgi:hypothetical protein
LTILFCLCTGIARAVDIPTWQVNDWWDLTRTFDVTLVASQSLSMSMVTTETARLTVTDIGDRTTTEAGIVRAYRRLRTNGAISGRGTVTASGVPINVRWKPGGSTSAGEDWVAVGDLGSVREHFTMNAVLQAQVIIVWLTLATITLDMTTDSGPGSEALDFPIQTVGEQWRSSATQHLYGRATIAFNASFPLWPGGVPPDDIDMPFDQTVRTASVRHFAGIESHGGIATTYRVEALTSATLWYAPNLEEIAEAALDDIEFTTGSHLRNVKSLITAASLAPDPTTFSARIAWPARVEWGDRFQVLGTTVKGTTVSATIVDEAASAQTVSSARDGRFELWLTAPAHNDHSPASDDQGSFGIEFAIQNVGRKVMTLQVYRPASRAGRWPLYR